MNRRLPIALAFIALTGALCGSAWQAWREHQQNLVLAGLLKASDQKLAAAQKDAKQCHDRLAEVSKKRAGSRKTAETSSAAASTGDKKDGPVDLTPYMEKMPEYARLRQLQMLRQVNRQYGDLKNLNLPPDQLDKLKNLLAEKMLTPQDAREAATQAGIEPNSPEMMKAMRNASAAVDADIKALVGPDQFTSLNNLQMQTGFRSNIEYQIAPDMNAAGLSLSAAQVSALAQAQQDAQKAAVEAMRNGSGTTIDFQTVVNQAMADQAAKVLTPDQLPVFQQSLAVSTQMSQLQAKAREAAQQELGTKITSWTMRGF